ncbi:regulatory protein RecX [Candidatus Daviesbacteria bacterium]|nr:regulatory protein RecX [Candidatus Daviesbacteria bacterium]
MSPTEKLLQKVYRLLSFRDRSEKEIRDYLKGKSENSGEIIEKLKEQGLMNDEKFAKEWVESRRRSKQKGVKALRLELWQKGINKEIIEQVVSYQLLAVSETQIAEKALEKKEKVWKNLEALEFRKKATDFLMRKGFEYEVAKVVVDNFLKNR